MSSIGNSDFARGKVVVSEAKSGSLDAVCGWVDESGLAVADFPRFEHSMKAVLRAGEALRGDLLWTNGNAPEIIEIFRIANNWRESHAYPMRSIRHEILGRMKSLRLTGITAARLKRMRSIRKKLRKLPENLNQIQDLGGCRAVLASIKDVNLLVNSIKNNSKHELFKENDYIIAPKIDGYRSHHLVFKFNGTGDAKPYDRRRIEIQIRTRLQHSWATAVEAVGLLRGEDFKGGQGDADWLRLFDLMSAELALVENSPIPNRMPHRHQRIDEIKHLDKKLHAVRILERLRHVVKYTDTAHDYHAKPEYYRLAYDNVDGTVSVTTHYQPRVGIADYNNAEIESDKLGDNKINTVFVEADKIEDLKEAYPNYFGDVQLFNTNLKAIIKDKHAREYTVAPKYRPPPPPQEPADLSWFRFHRRRRWK